MHVTVKHLEGIAFAGLGETRHWVVMDSEQRFGGLEGAARPMELVLMALGGCTGMDVASILRKMGVDLDDFEIFVDGEQAEDHPKVFKKIRLEYRFFGKKIDPEKVEKAIELSQERYCPVTAMLRQATPIHHSYKINPSRD